MPDAVELAVRKQMAEEIGDDELTKDQRFSVLQKFGLAAPRIDRNVTKPTWMSRTLWAQKLKEWYTITKGLAPQQQQKKYASSNSRFNKPSFRTFNRPKTFATKKPL